MLERAQASEWLERLDLGDLPRCIPTRQGLEGQHLESVETGQRVEMPDVRQVQDAQVAK